MDDELLAEVKEAFASACVDAGTDPARVRIWFAHGDPFAPGVPCSVHYEPDWEIGSDDDPIFDEETRAQANSVECLSLHRIAVQAGIDPKNRVAVAAVIGLIRHEVEHARQYDRVFGRQLKDLDRLANVIADHLDGAERVRAYRSKPVESSANAAAARFLKRRCPEHRAQLAGGKFAPFADDGEVWTSPASVDTRGLGFQSSVESLFVIMTSS